MKDSDLERKKAAIRKEIAENERAVEELEAARRTYQESGFLRRHLIGPPRGTKDWSGTFSEIELNRIRTKLESLRERYKDYQALDHAADNLTSFQEVVEQLQTLKQQIVHNLPTGEGSGLLMLLGLAAGIGDQLQHADDRMGVLIRHARQLVPKYYEEVRTWSRTSVDAEINKHGRDIDEVSVELDEIEKEGSVLTKSLVKPLKEYRRLLEDVRFKLDAIRLENQSPRKPAEEAARRVTEKVHEMNETVTLLERQCDEDVKMHPEQADAIRRRYRKAIDAILEQS